MSHFIGTAGIKGVLPASMMALSNALKENESFLEDYLHLYFNDDMQAFERKQNKHRHTSINDTASVSSTNLDTDGNEQALSESFRLKKVGIAKRECSFKSYQQNCSCQYATQVR